MLDTEAQNGAALRLRRIAGQVRGLERMVTAPRLCVDLLTQISAVQAALKSVADEVLHFHVERCVPDSFSRRLRKDERARLVELQMIFSQYCRFPREGMGAAQAGRRNGRHTASRHHEGT